MHRPCAWSGGARSRSCRYGPSEPWSSGDGDPDGAEEDRPDSIRTEGPLSEDGLASAPASKMSPQGRDARPMAAASTFGNALASQRHSIAGYSRREAGVVNRLVASLAALAASALAGCAATMAFQADSDAPRGTDAVLLMTATLTNTYRPSVRLEPLFVRVCRKGAADGSGCVAFRVDDDARRAAAEGGGGYFLRFDLDNGEHEILSLEGQDILHGSFVVPIHADVTTRGAGVFCLGHLFATMRAREAGEFRAAPPPFVWGPGGLVMEAFAGFGFYGATFDVRITDRSEENIADFRSRFAALRAANIERSILPPFDRSKAQRRWEADPAGRLREAR